MTPTEPYRIIVVGGGAGGLELVTRLGDALGQRPGVEIMLVDRQYSHIWKPLLHEVAAGTLNSNDDELSYLAHAHWHHFEFRLGALEALDRSTRTITLAPSVDSAGIEYIPRRQFHYDLLVISVGSVTNDFGIQGIAEHCLFLDGRAQADAFHQVLVRACYAANAQAEPLREGQLHIAIAGAGATGVELAAELHHSIRTLVAFGLDRIVPERDIRIHLIEGSGRILPGLAPRIADATHKVLESIGVIVHTGEFVTEATKVGFHTRSGRFIRPKSRSGQQASRAPTCWGGSTGSRPTASISSWCATRCKRHWTTISTPSATARPATSVKAARPWCRRVRRRHISRPPCWRVRSSPASKASTRR
jgi:NADH dehydrogenase